jgi:hypothetical protein
MERPITNLSQDMTIDELKAIQNRLFLEFNIKKQFGSLYWVHPQFLKEVGVVFDHEKGSLGSATAEYPLLRKKSDPNHATQGHRDHMDALARQRI